VPTNVVASGGLRFTPDLGHHEIDSFGRLALGSYDHIALELVGNPLGIESDDLIFEKSADTHTAAILANVSGTALCTVDVAGAFGRDLSAQGEAAMVDFASEWLAGLYGAEVKKAIKRTSTTRWNKEPYALGAWSCAVPGSQFARRQYLDQIATTSGMPAKPRMRPCGAPSAAPGNPASAPRMPSSAGWVRSSRPRRPRRRSKQVRRASQNVCVPSNPRRVMNRRSNISAIRRPSCAREGDFRACPTPLALISLSLNAILVYEADRLHACEYATMVKLASQVRSRIDTRLREFATSGKGDVKRLKAAQVCAFGSAIGA